MELNTEELKSTPQILNTLDSYLLETNQIFTVLDSVRKSRSDLAELKTNSIFSENVINLVSYIYVTSYTDFISHTKAFSSLSKSKQSDIDSDVANVALDKFRSIYEFFTDTLTPLHSSSR